MAKIWQLEGKKESFEKLLTDARHKLEELLTIKKKGYTNFLLPYQSILQRFMNSLPLLVI